MKRKKRVTKGRKVKNLRAAADVGRSEHFKPLKRLVSLRLDSDVLAWFRKSGPGYQTRINQALRKAMHQGS